MDNLNDRMNESLEFIRSRYGELLSLSEVATILKYDSVGAVRKAHSRKTLPVKLYKIPKKAGQYAKAIDVASYISQIPEA